MTGFMAGRGGHATVSIEIGMAQAGEESWDILELKGGGKVVNVT